MVMIVALLSTKHQIHSINVPNKFICVYSIMNLTSFLRALPYWSQNWRTACLSCWYPSPCSRKKQKPIIRSQFVWFVLVDQNQLYLERFPERHQDKRTRLPGREESCIQSECHCVYDKCKSHIRFGCQQRSRTFFQKF